jgi:CRP-like cAMP-binding protein
MHDNTVLVGLLPSDLALLAPLLHVIVLDQGSRSQQKLSLEHVYFPHQGMISLLGVTSRGETIEIASAGRDAALCPLLDPGAGEVIVIAQGAQSVSRVAIDRLQGVLRESETLRRALERCREDLLLQARQNLVCDGLHPVERRLSRWLLEAADRMQTDVIPITQEQVGRRLGVRRTTVTLVARKIQEMSAIRWSRSRVSILDRALLAPLACSCYTARRGRKATATPYPTS